MGYTTQLAAVVHMLRVAIRKPSGRHSHLVDFTRKPVGVEPP